MNDNKINPYIITDSISKGFLLNGLGTAALLAIPLVATSLSTAPISIVAAPAAMIAKAFAPLAVNSANEFIYKVGVTSIFASVGYFIRDYSREYFKEMKYEHYNGYIGGAVNYGLRDIAIQSFNGKEILPVTVILKAALGAINNRLYEGCAASKSCVDSLTSFVVIVESAEATVMGVVLKGGAAIPQFAVIGATAGVIISSCYYQVYAPLEETIHVISDNSYANLMGCVNSHEC